MFPWIKSVRAILSLVIVLTFAYLAMAQSIDPKDVMAITGMIIVFYFTRERNKK